MISKIQFKSGYHRLTISYLIGEATLIYPLYSIMFGERSHISAAGVGFLLAFWQITQILAELPTGIIADRFSKKYSIVAGRIFKAFCFFIWFVFPNFIGYMTGFFLWGIGEAFISGAVQAYLYELNEGTKNRTFLKSYSRLKSLEMLTYTVTYFTTFMIGPQYQLLAGLSVAGALISGFIAFTLPAGKVIEGQTTFGIIKGAVNNLSASKKLRRKFIETLSIAGTLGMLVELIVVNYRDYGASNRVAPLLISISTLITAVLFWLLHRYNEFFRKNTIKLLGLFVILFVILNNTSTWWQILGLFLITRYIRVLVVVEEAEIIDNISEKVRATIMSAFSLFSKILSALQIFLVGRLAVNNNINQPTSWFIISSLGLFTVIHTFNKLRKT